MKGSKEEGAPGGSAAGLVVLACVIGGPVVASAFFIPGPMPAKGWIAAVIVTVVLLAFSVVKADKEKAGEVRRALLGWMVLLVPFFAALAVLWMKGQYLFYLLFGMIVLASLPFAHAFLLHFGHLGEQDRKSPSSPALAGFLANLWLAILAALLVINYDGELGLPVFVTGPAFLFAISTALLLAVHFSGEGTVGDRAILLSVFRCVVGMILLLLTGLLYGAAKQDLCYFYHKNPQIDWSEGKIFGKPYAEVCKTEK